MVIEDSVAGLKAAKAAGMKCIICPDTFCEVDLSDFAGADLIVEELGEILSGRFAPATSLDRFDPNL